MGYFVYIKLFIESKLINGGAFADILRRILRSPLSSINDKRRPPATNIQFAANDWSDKKKKNRITSLKRLVDWISQFNLLHTWTQLIKKPYKKLVLINFPEIKNTQCHTKRTIKIVYSPPQKRCICSGNKNRFLIYYSHFNSVCNYFQF